MSEIRIKRLRELAKAVTLGREAVQREFTMRVPAEPDRDADLVISWAADHIKNLEECSMLKAYWELQGRIKELETVIQNIHLNLQSDPTKLTIPQMVHKLQIIKKLTKPLKDKE